MSIEPTPTPVDLASAVDRSGTADALAAYDAKRRTAALIAGRATDRTAFSFLGFEAEKTRRANSKTPAHAHEELDAVIATDAKGRPVPVLLTEHGEQSAADLDPITALFSACYPLGVLPEGQRIPQIAFADPSALLATGRHLGALARRGVESARYANRMLGVRSSLPVSVLTPVLTQMLTLRYWLPAGLDESDLADWAGALGADDDDYQRLWNAARRGTEPKHMLASAEAQAVRGGRFRGQYAAATSFRAAGGLAARYEASLALDPLLIERNLIEGTVASAQIVVADAQNVVAVVEETAMFRAERKYLAFAADQPDKKVILECTGLTVTDDGFAVLFAGIADDARKPNKRVVRDAALAQEPLLVTPQPYLGNLTISSTRPWQGPKEWTPREVPVDIALAGA